MADSGYTRDGLREFAEHIRRAVVAETQCSADSVGFPCRTCREHLLSSMEVEGMNVEALRLLIQGATVALRSHLPEGD